MSIAASYRGLVSAALMARCFDRVHNPVCETCRVLVPRGIVGAFKTWKPDIANPCMTGDIASPAGLTVHELDDGVVQFARWRPFARNAVSRSAVPASVSEQDTAEPRPHSRLPEGRVTRAPVTYDIRVVI